MRELLQLFRLIIATPKNTYCVLCLRTGTKRKLLEKNSLSGLLTALSDDEVWPWKHADNEKMKVCYICEARLASALKVIELVRCGVMADRLLQCFMKKELIGIESKNPKIEHPLKKAMSACNDRFKMAVTVSTIMVTEALAINIKGLASSSFNPQLPKESPVSTSTLQNLLTKQPPRTNKTPSNLLNINPGPSNPGLTTGVSTPGVAIPGLAIPSGIPKELTTPVNPTASPVTGQNLTSQPIPQVNPQHLKLTENLTIYNSGKYLALKTPGESVVLHAIFQSEDGKSYVPTLSVMIDGGKLLPMPDFGLKKSVTGNTLPEMGISLPGLEQILSGTNENLNKVDNNKVALPKLEPAISSTNTNNRLPMQSQSIDRNSRHSTMISPQKSAVNREFGILPKFDVLPKDGLPKFDAIPQFNDTPKQGMLTIDATIDLDNDSEIQSAVDFEDLIDFIEEETVPMEDDPLQQTEFQVPIPIKTETDNDSDPIWNLNTEANQNNFNIEPMLHSQEPLSNVDKALIRLDILNNYRKPIVCLKPLTLFKDQNNRVHTKFKKVQNYLKKDKNLLKSFKKDVDSIHSTVNIASTRTASVNLTPLKAKSPNKAYNNTVLINQMMADRSKSAIRLDSVVSQCVVLSDSDGDADVLPVQDVVKNPKLKDGYNMDWEDKIPMDVITYMDATDPALQPQQQPKLQPQQQPQPQQGNSTDNDGGAPLGVIVDAYSEKDFVSFYLDD